MLLPQRYQTLKRLFRFGEEKKNVVDLNNSLTRSTVITPVCKVRPRDFSKNMNSALHKFICSKNSDF